MRFRELLEGKMYVIELKRKEVRNEGLKLEIIYCESWVEEKKVKTNLFSIGDFETCINEQ